MFWKRSKQDLQNERRRACWDSKDKIGACPTDFLPESEVICHVKSGETEQVEYLHVYRSHDIIAGVCSDIAGQEHRVTQILPSCNADVS